MSTATRMHKNLSDNPENMLPMSSWWTVNGNCQTRKVMTHERHRQLSWKHQWTSRSPCVDICTFPLLYMLIHRIDLQTAQSSWLSVPGTFIEGFWHTLTSQFSITVWIFPKKIIERLLEDPSQHQSPPWWTWFLSWCINCVVLIWMCFSAQCICSSVQGISKSTITSSRDMCESQ